MVLCHLRNNYFYQYFSQSDYLEDVSRLHKTFKFAHAQTRILSFLPFPSLYQVTMLLPNQCPYLTTLLLHQSADSLSWSAASPEDLEVRGSDYGTLRGFLWLLVLRLYGEPGVKLGSGGRSNSSTAQWFRLHFQPCAAWTAAYLWKSSWSPADCAMERTNTGTHRLRSRKGREAPVGQRTFLRTWMHSSFKGKAKQPLNTLRAHENVENLAKGRNRFRISLVLPAPDLYW